MPCYTVVQVEVKVKALAEKALKEMGIEGTVTKNANGTYTVKPKQIADRNFRDNFLQKYTTLVAKKKARMDGYTVTEKEENGQTVLYMRKY